MPSMTTLHCSAVLMWPTLHAYSALVATQSPHHLQPNGTYSGISNSACYQYFF